MRGWFPRGRLERRVPLIGSRLSRPLAAIGISLGVHGALLALVQVAPPGTTGGAGVIEARLMQVAPHAEQAPDTVEAPMPEPDVALLSPGETAEALPVAAAQAPPVAEAAPPAIAPSDAAPAPGADAAPDLAISSGVDLTYYGSRELDAPPRALRDILPDYPHEADRLRQSGKVRLQLKLEADGRVSNVEVLGADPPGMFDESARKAFGAARFAPPLKGGRPVRALLVIEVAYDWAGRSEAAIGGKR